MHDSPSAVYVCKPYILWILHIDLVINNQLLGNIKPFLIPDWQLLIATILMILLVSRCKMGYSTERTWGTVNQRM